MNALTLGDWKRRYNNLQAGLCTYFATVRDALHYRIQMWTYPKAELSGRWSLTDLWDRISAAKQLGYGCQLDATPAGLVVYYTKPVPAPPYL